MTTLFEDLQAWRRHFHQIPEAGWEEFVTTAEIAALCRGWGFDVLMGTKVINPDFVRGRKLEDVKASLARARAMGTDEALLTEMEMYTGCVAIWDTKRPGPTTALRFDIDCVYVDETTKEDHIPCKENFRSKHPGLMHACGHDGHIAMGLATARWISQHSDELSGVIKIVFQPAEEGVRGAAAIAESGILDDVNFFASSHLSFCAKSGELVANPNQFLCTTKLDVRFKGKPAHAGSSPHLGHNALLAAAHAVTQMHGISRHGGGMTRINVGVLKAGEGRNVIPSSALLQLEVRGENADINQYMVDQVVRIAQGIAVGFDVTMEYEIMGEAVDLINDMELVDRVMKLASKHPKLQTVKGDHNFNGSEDATILARRVQRQGGKAIYFIVGADRTAGHHQAEFDFDEQAMLTGVELYTELLLDLNHK